MMKTVTTHLALHNGYGSPPRLVEWSALETGIPGLYLTRPAGSYPDGNKEAIPEPSKTCWNVTHKSGYVMTPMQIKSLPRAKSFLAALSQQGLDWDRPIEECLEEYKVYMAAVRMAWELTQL